MGFFPKYNDKTLDGDKYNKDNDKTLDGDKTQENSWVWIDRIFRGFQKYFSKQNLLVNLRGYSQRH